MGVAVAADAHARERALEGHATHGEGRGGRHDADGVNGVHLIGHEGGGHDLDLVAEAGREARAQRAVDHAGREGGLLGRARLALEVAAGDAAHGVHLLDEVDRQREEVVVLALLGDHRGEKDRGVARLDEAGAGGLLGKLAGLEDVVLAVEVELVRNLCHIFSLISACPIAGGPSWRPCCRPPPAARAKPKEGAPAGAPS